MDETEPAPEAAAVPAPDPEALLSIGAFARRVGLAPSALRFYDDCGILRPARVDGATGYRSYAPAQEPRALLVRRLREAGLPLVDALVVLDGPQEEAAALLRAQLRRARDMAAAARAAVEDLLRGLPGEGVRGASARIGGAELASAVRQVAPAAAGAGVREEFPALGCVLLELDGRPDGQEVRLVATDRYRLSVRVLSPYAADGGPCRALVDAAGMRDLASWAVRLPEVTVEIDGADGGGADGTGAGTGGSVRVRGGAECRTLPAVQETFPSYRLVLEDLPPLRNRLVTDRGALRRALTDGGGAGGAGGPVTLDARAHELAVSGPRPGARSSVRTRAPTVLPAVLTGPPLRAAFDPGVLLPALEAGVGPDVLLEFRSGGDAQPVVVRSADQGSFTTLVMPVRDTTAPEDH